MVSEKNGFKRKVLVVDDEEVNRLMLGAILEQKYEVEYAADGLEALRIIEERDDALSAVLLDILMPQMDGFAVLNQLAELSLLSKIPVIVLTSEKSAEIKSLQIGAADFLAKPYDSPEVILARVGHSIKLFEDARIIQATEYDSLTQLLTPEFFYEYASQTDKHFPDAQMDSVVLDFTRFHLLNELRGREFGDSVLEKTADAIRVVQNEFGGLACRHDADTFYLYVRHTDNYELLKDVLQKELSSVLENSEIRIRIGINFDMQRASSLEERFSRAMQACNSLRSFNSISFAVYDAAMHERELFEARLLNDFETAIKQKQFRVNYQPKFNIKGAEPRLSSAEALVSWLHPELGRIRPDLFIPLFESNGLVQTLDRYVWNEVAVQMREWKEKFGVCVPISVNVSRVDINDPGMTDFILKIVDENGLDHHDYLLEITESAYTSNSADIIAVVNGLRDKGFRIEMDDFGSGYSSLNMLTTMPIDALKMDKAFIMNIAEGNKEMKIVSLILEVAEFFKVPVVAEGVETKEQLDLLKAAGCDIIQGFYFSRPVPPEEFEGFIKESFLK